MSVVNLWTLILSDVNFTPRPLYPRGRRSQNPLNRRILGPYSTCGSFEEKIKVLSVLGIEPRFLSFPVVHHADYCIPDPKLMLG
jgi:hypothetical protein